MDLKQGIICSISGEKAKFEKECPDYELDETIKVREPDHKEGLLKEDIEQKLSSEAFEKLRMEQNLFAGLLAGSIIGVMGAILWAFLTVVTGFQIGYMALVIGVSVGFGVRIFGKGIDRVFGYWSALIALLSIVFGNVLSVMAFLAGSLEIGYIEMLFVFDYSGLFSVMIELFDFRDLLFYGLALFTGFTFAFRKITEKDIQTKIFHL